MAGAGGGGARGPPGGGGGAVSAGSVDQDEPMAEKRDFMYVALVCGALSGSALLRLSGAPS